MYAGHKKRLYVLLHTSITLFLCTEPCGLKKNQMQHHELVSCCSVSAVCFQLQYTKRVFAPQNACFMCRVLQSKSGTAVPS